MSNTVKRVRVKYRDTPFKLENATDGDWVLKDKLR